MATAPKSIKVLVLPANGKKHYPKSLETVQTDIKPAPPVPEWMDRDAADMGCRLYAEAHVVFHFMERAPQPKISLLPNTRGEHWDDEAWRKRSVKSNHDGLQMFFTHSTRNLEPNPYFKNLVWGDVFLLKLSDTIDRDGRAFYVNLESKHFTAEDKEMLVRAVARSPKYYTDEHNGGKEGPEE